MLGVTRALLPKLSTAHGIVPIRNIGYNWVHKEGEISMYTMSPEVPKTSAYIGDWPRTKEERERAAKKYNMLPEDYEPYPEGEGWGDYPNFKAVGEYNRDKYDDYDEPWDFRFYGEPIHRDFDLYKWERLDPLDKEKPQYLPSIWIRLLVFFGLPVSLITFETYTIKHKICYNPPFKVRKSCPGQPLYTFPYSPNDGTAPHLSHH